MRLNRELVFAHRLGLKLGIKKPEQWLEDVDDYDYEQWHSYYCLEPFGNERELLSRCVSLLMLIAMKDVTDSSAVLKACDSILGSLMPAEWIGQPEPISEEDSIKTFEATVMRQFG